MERRNRVLKEATAMHNYFEPKLADEPINVELNGAIERALAGKAELPRPYLGASIVGSECLRRAQFDWWVTPVLDARTRAIFARGHAFEARVREQLVAAGLKFAPPGAGAFAVVDGDLRGHADGVIIAGPNPLGAAEVNYPLIWECKALNAKNWRALARNGLEKEFPRYAAQVALYQAYLKLTNLALFTAVNVDSCLQLHFWVPFSAERAQLWSDRAANIIAASRAGDLLPRAYDDPAKFPCKICPHVARCWR
jgi:hypothetical protein